MPEDLHRIRGEADERAHTGIVERLDAERIDGAEEPSPGGVPHGEREVAEEVIGALDSPLEVGGEEQPGIRGGPPLGRTEPVDKV